jgi:hypothetical protein
MKQGLQLLNKASTLPTFEELEKWELTEEISLLNEAMAILSECNGREWKEWRKHNCPVLSELSR